MNIGVFSNINLFRLTRKLRKKFSVYEREGYGVWIPELIETGEKSYQTAFFILDGKELFCDAREDKKTLIEEYMGYIKTAVEKNPNIQYFVSDLDIYDGFIDTASNILSNSLLEAMWVEQLDELCKGHENLFCFPLKASLSDLGRKSSYSKKMWYLASSPFSEIAEKEIAKQIYRTCFAIEGKRKKCILLDLDNTLWGGVVGEEGVCGITLSKNKEGARYRDFQKKILEIKRQGILLCIVSKNNEIDAKEVFETHSDMVLKWDDFVIKKINWNDKAENIKEIQRELNIGLDSMVFIDDNARERECVRSQLPEVIVPEFPHDTCTLTEFITEIYQDYFLTLTLTDEDSNKSNMYQQRIERNKEIKKHNTMEDYLYSLNTKVYLKQLTDDDLERAIQLVQKTNQFNLTTIRCDKNDLKIKITSSNYDIWLGEAADRFGSNGKSILIIVKREKCRVVLENFIMSCRIMGRCIEDSILFALEELYKEKGYKEIVGEYKETQKNIPVREFYKNKGYCLINCESEKQQFVKRLEERKIDEQHFAEIIWEEIGEIK